MDEGGYIHGLYKGGPPLRGGGGSGTTSSVSFWSPLASLPLIITPPKKHTRRPPKEYPVVIRILVLILLLFVSNRRLHLYRILKVYLILFWLPRKLNSWCLDTLGHYFGDRLSTDVLWVSWRRPFPSPLMCAHHSVSLTKTASITSYIELKFQWPCNQLRWALRR